MRELADSFIQDRRKDLLTMRDDIQRSLEMATEEFEDLLSDVATKDYPAIAKEEQDKEALGRIQLTDWNRLRRISSALARMEQGSYGECQVCGAPIDSERLKAMPDAPLCMPCQSRQESATGPEVENQL
jgi:DnaK suppressor protein